MNDLLSFPSTMLLKSRMFARFTAQFSGDIDPTDPEVVGVKWVPFGQVESLVRYGPPPECEERNPLIWLPTRDFIGGRPRTYYPI